MSDFTQTMTQHQDLPEDKQRQAGAAISGDMSDDHAQSLQLLIGMIDRKEIVLGEPSSLLHSDVYNALPKESQDAIDLSLLNLHDQVRIIHDFYRSEETPNSSPHLETMIEQLWKQKERLEEQWGDVFKL